MAAQRKTKCLRGHNMQDGSSNMGFQKAVSTKGTILTTRYCKACKQESKQERKEFANLIKEKNGISA